MLRADGSAKLSTMAAGVPWRGGKFGEDGEALALVFELGGDLGSSSSRDLRRGLSEALCGLQCGVDPPTPLKCYERASRYTLPNSGGGAPIFLKS